MTAITLAVACGRTLEFTRVSGSKDAGGDDDDDELDGGRATASKDAGSTTPPAPPPAKTFRRAFVTQRVVRGKLSAGSLTDNLDGARQRGDAICAADAVAAQLQGRSFKAWIRVGDSTPISVFREGDGWAMVDGTVIFDSFAAAGGLPAHALNLSAKGELVGEPLRAWTGMPSLDCQGWTTDNLIPNGNFGSISASDGTWQAAGDHNCFDETRLYCFED